MNELLTTMRRTPYQSVAAFMVLFMTLLLSTAIFISLCFLYGLLGYIETRPQITIYFKNNTAPTQIYKVRDELLNSGKILSVKYVSKEEAFQIFKKRTQDNPLLQEMVSSDILPASLEINTKSPDYLNELYAYLQKQPNKDEVQFEKNIADRLITLTNVLRRSSAVLFLFLLIMAVVVLTTTTMFKIAMKKDEIELLRLLGASNFYIIKPFVLDGFFFAWLASIASFVIVTGVMFYLQPFLTTYFRDIQQLSIPLWNFSLPVWPVNVTFLLITFALSTLFGMGIAVVATFAAGKKYLS